MKNIDKMIVEKYHEEQKNKIKNRIGLESKNDYEYLNIKHRNRLFVPSLISLCVSVIFLITASILLIIANPQYPEQIVSYAEQHLKLETIDYVERPITTLVDAEAKVTISIYYGVVGDALAEHSHYLVFEIISDKGIIVDTEILRDDLLLWSHNFIFDDRINNFYSFETNYDTIDIRFTVGSIVQEITLNLTSYYNFLRK